MKTVKFGVPVSEVITPAILVDLDIMEYNIREVATRAKNFNKQLWPMVKTHKSLEIARMQQSQGATGFLCGTISEAEMLVYEGSVDNIMLAYPVADKQNLDRCIKLLDRANIIFRIDNEETARLIHEALVIAGKTADYVIKVDVGVHRFGIPPDKAKEFIQKLGKYKKLNFFGISTHPGNAYSSKNKEELRNICKKALADLNLAYDELRGAGYEVKMVTIGSTPSFRYDLEDDLVTHLHPGNYLYYDAMQVSLGTVSSDRCALSVLTTVTSKNDTRKEVSINAGVKIFSRDLGGHEIKVVNGYGIVKNYPKAIVKFLSEEVGIIDVRRGKGIRVGSKLEIIPNHACVVNNQTNYLIGCRNGIVEKLISVDARVNTVLKSFC